MTDYGLLACLLLPAVAAVIAPWLGRRTVWAGTWLALAPALLALWLGNQIGGGEVLSLEFPWAPRYGLAWSFELTPLRMFMGLIVVSVGVPVSVYASSYFDDGRKRGRMLAFLYLFMTAMLGLVLSDNLVVVAIFWEATSVLSFLMIGFYNAKPEARRAAVDAFLVTGAGGLALVLAVVLLGQAGGSLAISELSLAREVIQSDSRYPLIVALVLIAVMTKSAQIPCHFWLPGAMTAPAPVSAFLHSATMVKAGIFLVLVLQPVLGDTALWQSSLMILGCVSMTLGAVVAVLQTDLKRILAYSTISALGMLLMLFGLGQGKAFKAGLIFLLVHALYKAALFMVAGALEHATGTRDVRKLGGLYRSLPMLGVAAIIAACSMSGVPPMIGFIAKELIYEVKTGESVPALLLVCTVIANVATVAVAFKVGIAPFLLGSPSPAKPLPVGFSLPPLLLAIFSVVLGIFPNQMLGVLLEGMVSTVAPSSVDTAIKHWHGFNRVLLLSLLTVSAGLGIFGMRRRLWGWGLALSEERFLNAQTGFRTGLSGFVGFAGRLTKRLHGGRLHVHIAVTLTTAIALVVYVGLRYGGALELPPLSPVSLSALMMVLLVGISTAAVVFARDQRIGILLLGCSGFGMIALYANFGAPDVAITQLIVETVALVVFAALLLRSAPPRSPRIGRRATLLSLLAGGTFAWLTLKAASIQATSSVAGAIADLSLPAAHGRNVVNVILVDFRAFDTLGEVTVLLVAMLGIVGLAGKRSQESQDAGPAVLRAATGVLVPVLALFSVFLLLRGHNLPGGGFIGGLVAGIAMFLHRGTVDAQQLALVGGLSCLLASFMGLLSGTFLQAQWGPSISLPVLGKVALGTPLIFDCGVYLAVAGFVLCILQRVNANPPKEAASWS